MEGDLKCEFVLIGINDKAGKIDDKTIFIMA